MNELQSATKFIIVVRGGGDSAKLRNKQNLFEFADREFILLLLLDPKPHTHSTIGIDCWNGFWWRNCVWDTACWLQSSHLWVCLGKMMYVGSWYVLMFIWLFSFETEQNGNTTAGEDVHAVSDLEAGDAVKVKKNFERTCLFGALV